MEKTFDASEVQSNFENILDMVAKGDTIVIEQDGKPTVAIMPIEAYRKWQQQIRREFFDKLQEISERINMSEEEADELIEEAIRWVRSNKDD